MPTSRAFRLNGSRALDGSARAVDNARLVGMLNSAPVALPEFPSPGFVIERVADANISAVVQLADDAPAGLADSLAPGLAAALALLPRERTTPCDVRIREEAGRRLLLSVRSYVPNEAPGFDRDAAYALFCNVLAALHARGTSIVQASIHL
jgi:hypothetical protein